MPVHEDEASTAGLDRQSGYSSASNNSRKLKAMTRTPLFVLALAALTALPAAANRGIPDFALPDPAAEAESEPLDIQAGYDAIDAGDYETAITVFEAVLDKDPRDAEAHNQLGYVHRRLQDFPRAFSHYRTALSIDPAHTGAHNYIGEAYLETGQLEMAEGHLRELDMICLFGCDDYYELAQAVALYKANNNTS